MFTFPNIYKTDGYVSLDTFSLVTGATPTAAKLLGFRAINTDSAINYVQVFDGYAQPLTGAVPIVSVPALAIANGGKGDLDCTAWQCIQVSKGIVIALSSTAGSYTPVATKMMLTAFFVKP